MSAEGKILSLVSILQHGDPVFYWSCVLAWPLFGSSKRELQNRFIEMEKAVCFCLHLVKSVQVKRELKVKRENGGEKKMERKEKGWERPFRWGEEKRTI
jgi:hypothetical protein